MSDLDADLYGDLYDTDFADQAPDEKATAAPEQAHQESTPTPASRPQESAPAKPSPPSIDVRTPVFSTPTVQTPIAPTILPPTQQIPTYEQPQDDYGDSSRADGGYQNISVAERTIRPSEMKDEGKMFIGGLNWDTTDESLRNYFSQFGKVDACTIMRDAGGRSRCFAFLTFDDPASVNAVMVKEHFLDGKAIDPKRAIPRQEHQRATKLFIGGLAGSVTSESMREFFSQFGKVIDSTVMLDRETGRSKGFGFISFEDTNVQPFLGFGNLEIDGKLIDVKLAQPRYQRDNYSEDNQAGGDYTGAAAVGRGAGAGAVAAQANFSNPMAATGTGNTPFDPQALAQLYTRMFQMTGGGAMNPMMAGMNPMMASMANTGFGGPGNMRGMGNMGAIGMGMGGGGMSMGRGGMMQGAGATNLNPNIPRGPRGGPGGPGVGPQRAAQRGQHNYHPYAR